MLRAGFAYAVRCRKTAFQLELAVSITAILVTTTVAATVLWSSYQVLFKKKQKLSIEKISCYYEGRDSVRHHHFLPHSVSTCNSFLAGKRPNTFKNCWHLVCGVIYVLSWKIVHHFPWCLFLTQCRFSSHLCGTPFSVTQTLPIRQRVAPGLFFSLPLFFAYSMGKTSVTNYTLMTFEFTSPDQRSPLISKCVDPKDYLLQLLLDTSNGLWIQLFMCFWN